jgi:hypothetical protein
MPMVARVAKRCLLCIFLCGTCAYLQRVYAQWNETIATLRDDFRLSVAHSRFSSSAYTVSLRFPLGGPHALNVTGEYFRASSMPRDYERRFRIDPDWKFRSIPITFSYSYTLPAVTQRVHPVVGVGLSTHLYYEKTRLASGIAVLGEPMFDRHYGIHVGAEATMGMRFTVNPHVFLLGQTRLRYVGDLSQAPSRSPYGPFTWFDFSLGLGFEL